MFTAGASTSESSCKNTESKKLGENNKTNNIVKMCRLKTRMHNLCDLAFAAQYLTALSAALAIGR